jgi:hypothetical protein
LANTALTNFAPILPNSFHYHVSYFFAPTVQGPMPGNQSCILKYLQRSRALVYPSEIVFKNGVEL